MPIRIPPPLILPVVQKTKSAYILWYRIYENSPKPFRTAFGFRIENAFIDLLELEFLATYARRERKENLIEEAQIKIDILRFLFQTAWEAQHIRDKQYIAVSTILEEAGRMIFGWRKSLMQKLPFVTTK